MKNKKSFFLIILLMFLILPLLGMSAADALMVVGLYSETDAGYVSYRVGSGAWKVIKVGDKIPDNAEITVTVFQDWVELCPVKNTNNVFEIAGSDKPVVIKVSDILKGKAKSVNIPKTGDKGISNKIIVKGYLGRQQYKKDDKTSWRDLKYGDILESTGAVRIIAINNTLNLILPDGKEVQVVGPIKFNIAQILKGENIYKYLNVAK